MNLRRLIHIFNVMYHQLHWYYCVYDYCVCTLFIYTQEIYFAVYFYPLTFWDCIMEWNQKKEMNAHTAVPTGSPSEECSGVSAATFSHLRRNQGHHAHIPSVTVWGKNWYCMGRNWVLFPVILLLCSTPNSDHQRKWLKTNHSSSQLFQHQ